MEEVSATSASLYISIQGTSFFSGQLALTRAREVAQFVAALRELGLTDAEIQLLSVTASETSGLLSRTSSAFYELKVHCKSLDSLTDILGAITSQKNIQLQRIQWVYDGLDTLRDTLQDRCLAELNRCARRIAAGLGVTLLGVHHYEEQWTYPEGETRVLIGSMAPQNLDRTKSRMIRKPDLGMSCSHRERLQLFLQADYRVSGFAPSP